MCRVRSQPLICREDLQKRRPSFRPVDWPADLNRRIWRADPGIRSSGSVQRNAAGVCDPHHCLQALHVGHLPDGSMMMFNAGEVSTMLAVFVLLVASAYRVSAGLRKGLG